MSLRRQVVSPNPESRPLPRDNKKLGILKRWASRAISFHRHSHSNNNSNSNSNSNSSNRNQRYHTNTNINTNTNTNTITRTDTHNSSSAASDTSMATSSSSSSSSPSLILVRAASSSSSHNLCSTSTTHNNHQHRHHNNNNNNNNKHMATYCQTRHVLLPSASSGPLNIMHWMQNDCPNDVIPLILAFAGPQRIAIIGRTNRFWRQVTEQEATWRRLCEELYKVRT